MAEVKFCLQGLCPDILQVIFDYLPPYEFFLQRQLCRTFSWLHLQVHCSSNNSFDNNYGGGSSSPLRWFELRNEQSHLLTEEILHQLFGESGTFHTVRGLILSKAHHRFLDLLTNLLTPTSSSSPSSFSLTGLQLHNFYLGNLTSDHLTASWWIPHLRSFSLSCDLGYDHPSFGLSRLLKSVTALTSLDLSARFWLRHPYSSLDSIASLLQLKTLNLSYSQLGHPETTSLEFLSKLTKLTNLNLTMNRLTSAHISLFLPTLTSLTVLRVGRNELQNPGILLISRSLKDLVLLDISKNGLTSLEGVLLPPSLTSFSLSENNINLSGSPGLSQLPKLKQLNLRGTSLTDDGVYLLKLPLLASVTELDLSNNQLAESCVGILTQLSGLRSLNVGGNQIGDTGLRQLVQSLSSLPRRLLRFDFWNNRLTRECEREILAWVAERGNRRGNEKSEQVSTP